MATRANQEGIPSKYLDMVGKSYTMQDAIRGKEEGHQEEMEIKDVRFGTGVVMCMTTFEEKHPTIEFLVQPKGYKKSVWTLGFPCVEIELEND